jgi:cysteine desulfurase
MEKPNMLYMDYCATTPPFEEVVDSVSQTMKRYFGNPSSLHHFGVEAEKLIGKARSAIAQAIFAKPEEIIFTSCATESNNLAIKGAAREYRSRGNHIITTMIEHASVYESCKQLEQEGYRVTWLPVDDSGMVDPNRLEQAIEPNTVLVSVMHVNNEMGSIQPIQEIGSLLRNRGKIIFHVDAVQSMGKLPLHPAALGIDLLSCSGHKIRGPKGVGFLYRRNGVKLQPLLSGGGQEAGIRSGTENVPLIVGMARAIRMTMESRDRDVEHLYKLRDRLVAGLRHLPQLRVTGTVQDRRMAPHIVHFTVPGMRPEVVVHALEEYNIYISTRSACSSGESSPSRVLEAMGLPEEMAISGLRVSLWAEHTTEHIDYFIRSLDKCLKQWQAGRKPEDTHDWNNPISSS